MTQLSSKTVPPALCEWAPDVVDACRRGDRDALERVFRAELPALENTLGRFLCSHSELRDVLQKTLINAVGAFPRFRGEASVRTWLVSIAVRTAIDHLRTQRRRPEVLAAVDGADSAAGPDKLLADRQALDRVREHLSVIAPKKRIAFVLTIVEERPIEEVAALMGASVAATRSRVFFARRELLSRMRRDKALRGNFDGGDP